MPVTFKRDYDCTIVCKKSTYRNSVRRREKVHISMTERREVEKYLLILELQRLAVFNPFKKMYIRRLITFIKKEIDNSKDETINLEKIGASLYDELFRMVWKENTSTWNVQLGVLVLNYFSLMNSSGTEESANSSE